MYLFCWLFCYDYMRLDRFLDVINYVLVIHITGNGMVKSPVHSKGVGTISVTDLQDVLNEIGCEFFQLIS